MHPITMKNREERATVQIWWKQKCSKIEGNFSCSNVYWMISLIAPTDWEKAIWYKMHILSFKTLSKRIIWWGPGLDWVKLNSLHKLYQNRESLMVCMGVIRTDGRLQDGYKPFQLIWITNGTRPRQAEPWTNTGRSAANFIITNFLSCPSIWSSTLDCYFLAILNGVIIAICGQILGKLSFMIFT